MNRNRRVFLVVFSDADGKITRIQERPATRWSKRRVLKRAQFICRANETFVVESHARSPY